MFARKKSKVVEGVSVRLISEDEELQRQVSESFGDNKKFLLEGTNTSLRDSDAIGHDGELPSLLVADLDATNPEHLNALHKTMSNGAAGVPVVVVADQINYDTVRAFLHMKVSDWLPKPLDSEEFLNACERAIQPSSSPALEAKCYTFIGTAGGVGTTTLAIQAAFILANQKKSKFNSTCLVDMDFQTGSVSDYLDVEPNLQIGEISSTPDRLDQQLLNIMLSQHETGLSVLAAPTNFARSQDVDSDLIAQLLNQASVSFSNLVIDMPRAWLPWSEDILLGSNKIFIVSEMTVPGVRQAKNLLDAIHENVSKDLDVSVIVNRYKRRFIGSSVRKDDVKAVLGENIAGFVSENYALVREAIDRGVPLTEVRRSNRIVKDLREILNADAAGGNAIERGARS